MRPTTPTALSFSLLLVLAPGLAGCIEGPNFDPAEIVKTPRILAIVADHPDAPPGQDVRLRALVVDPEGRPLDLQWTACANAELLTGGDGISGAQYGMQRSDIGCDAGNPGVIPLAREGDVGVLPGALTMLAFSELDRLGAVFGPDLPPDLLERLANDVGLPFTVQVTVRTGGAVIVRGFKRVLLRNGDPHGTNPPEPRFRIDERWYTTNTSAGAAPFECVPEDGGAREVTAAHDAHVRLHPDPDDARWAETYTVLDPQGGLLVHQESAYYSWFATAGRFAAEVTQTPTRDNEWVAPTAPGMHSLWLVVRDGHGGNTACRTHVIVE